jgi:hypothetical protein
LLVSRSFKLGLPFITKILLSPPLFHQRNCTRCSLFFFFITFSGCQLSTFICHRCFIHPLPVDGSISCGES